MTVYLKDKIVKIRKPQKCFGCGREFPKGTKLRYVVQINDDFNYCYWCDTCGEYWHKFMHNDDLINFGELRYNDKEGWEEVRKVVEGEKENGYK